MNIGLFGFGNVGGGVGKIIFDALEQNDFPFSLTKIGVQSLEETDFLGIPSAYFTEEKNDILEDESIDIVIEVIGGITTAKEIIETALKNGKHVITANKALLAEHGNELFSLAKHHGVHLKFEAAVGGGIPIIRTLQTHYSIGDISRIAGIVNGTCNFMLSALELGGKEYQQVLLEAQQAGFAEKDPTFDVEGYDAAQKLALLSHLAFGIEIPDWKKIETTGISGLQSADFLFAHEIDKKIRLIVSAEKTNNQLYLSVSPCFVPRGGTLGSINGPTNVICIDHQYLGEISMKGAGAGRYPTAMSVISDLWAILRNEVINPMPLKDLQITDLSSPKRSYYIRCFVKDCPGVLSTITSIFGRHGVSIDEIKNAHGSTIPLCILTHSCLSDQKNMILKDLGVLDIVLSEVLCLEVYK